MNNKSRIFGDLDAGVVTVDGVSLDPRKSQAVYNHSPEGFSWGYSGSGPSQLALALLLETTTEEEAVKWYQEFKHDCIAVLPRKNFLMTADWIYTWLDNKRKNNEV